MSKAIAKHTPENCFLICFYISASAATSGMPEESLQAQLAKALEMRKRHDAN